jgi:hypothetical protein
MNKRQQDKVLAYLKRGNWISQERAIKLFRAFRLSSIIHRLREDGHEIVTKLHPNKKGDGHHARYTLSKEGK